MSATGDSTAATAGPATRIEAARRPVRAWLALVALMVVAMVIVGGATRLTDSGLSITEWQLITGVVPPLGDAAWAEAFAKYQRIPEYRVINRGMSLDEFKFIYWWEWAHRFLGRFVGVVFFVPLAFFWATGRLAPWLKGRLAGIFLLGAGQGALGWFMVMSGLVERTDVSQYRLAAHLALAVLLFALIAWTVLNLSPRRQPASTKGAKGAAALTALIFLQIVLGAFVAGLDAGQGYNTWPLMDGRLVPDGLGAMTPWYLNLFENALTVQFDHRVVAYLVVLAALAQAAAVLRRRAEGALAASAWLLVAAALAQTALGVWTLLERVPLALGLAHQAGALALLAIVLWHWHLLRRA